MARELVFSVLFYGGWVLPAYLVAWIYVRQDAEGNDGVVTWGNALAFLFFPITPILNMFVVVMGAVWFIDSIKDKPCIRLKRRLTDAEVEALIKEIESLKKR